MEHTDEVHKQIRLFLFIQNVGYSNRRPIDVHIYRTSLQCMAQEKNVYQNFTEELLYGSSLPSFAFFT